MDGHRVFQIEPGGIEMSVNDDGTTSYIGQARQMPGFCNCDRGELHATDPEARILSVTRQEGPEE